MPLFISDTELQVAGGNIALIVEQADVHIQDLLQQLEAHKARADAATIMAEQRGAVVEQKFLTMSSQFKHMESEKSQLEQTLDRRSAELAEVQAQVHKLELEAMKQDSDRERLSCELNEARKTKRELLEVVEQKNAEATEKNTYIKGYLEKIVFLTDERSILEGKLREAESELNRSRAVQARLLQEKELLEKHNSWLNEELTDQVDALSKERRTSSDLEMELHSKLSRAEQACKEMGESLQRNKEHTKDVELRLKETREELRSTKEEAANKEDHLSLEVETASKLAELYKQSSEEWSKKAVDLEGVIKALEVHLNQVETDLKERLQKEVEGRKDSEKDVVEAKDKIEKLEKELELSRSCNEKDSLLLIDNIPEHVSKELTLRGQQLSPELHEDGLSLPMITSGVSGTALAAALLRDGWNLTKVYMKYQEAVDAWRHERQERKQSQALLQRVLQEIEQRAEFILEERVEHARMAEAYAIMEEKLYSSVEEQSSLGNQIKELKAELRKRERDLNGARQECSDLQTEVTVLLKECADIKQRFGGERFQIQGSLEKPTSLVSRTAADAIISERLLTFKDIHELVEQNNQLRVVVRSLGHQNEEFETKLKEAFDMELKKRTDEATQKVSVIVKRSEEQLQLIASLQGTVGMYKRLYEEELKYHTMLPKNNGNLVIANEICGEDLRKLVVTSKEDIEKVRKDAAEQILVLENDLNKARQDASVARLERDRVVVEATYAREQLQSIVKESGNQRKEMDAVLGRNVEFTQIITDYQRRLRENAEHVQLVEEKSRRLSVEVSVLEREKELLSFAEKRASQELSSLSDRVHRLQATLDSIDTVKEVQESMRSAEKKKLEDEVNRMQKEWVDMKHELDSERAHTRHLSHERDLIFKQTMDRIESISKELADALQKVSAAETQAHLAQARCVELEASLKKADEKIVVMSSKRTLSKNSKDVDFEPNMEVVSTLEQLEQAREEIERLKEELDASKNHIDQYKRLAQHNEEALLQMQNAHNHFKEESEKTKELLSSELTSIREKAADLEKQLGEKENELATTISQREHALSTAEREIILLRDADSGKRTLLDQAEERIKAFKNELEKEHQQWRTAQNNYERQVLLQADTIRELTIVSERNGILEKEVLEFRAKAELSVTDLTSAGVAWEMEKASFQSENESLANKIKELQEQNRILLDQVEATHILVAEHDKNSGDHTKAHENVGNELQDVIRYLRRSKDASDMEVSLLKQERLRLQKQLESALHAAEAARANLRREHENTRLALCSEEEFKSLQAQVREMTLLRESNDQLRLENKRNFDECQFLHEKLQRGQEEVESIRKLLRDREVELEATAKTVDMQKAEISRWENRVSQLLQKYKTIDVEDYNRVQAELASSQEAFRVHQAELDASKGELQKLQEGIRSAEQESLQKDEKIAELERKVKDFEASTQVSVKAETERYKKQAMFFKRKVETLTKEKDDTRDLLLKQVDELRASANKRAGESHRSETQIRQEISSQHEQAQKENENLMREKDSRIQTLERALEREREVLKAERGRRQKDRQAYMEAVGRLDNEKQKLNEELSVLKREKESFSESVQGKKFGRKIVRPKIESPVESQIHLESNDMGNEASIEAIDVENEARDDAKHTSGEGIESVNTTSAIVVASTFVASSASDGAPSLRKRLSQSLIEEPPVGLSASSETAPALKRQKGLECDIVSMVPSVAMESIVTAETSKGLDMDSELAEAGDSVASHRSETNTLVTAGEIAMTDSIENNEAFRSEAVQKEQNAPKRPRIVRSDPSFIRSPLTERDETALGVDNENTSTTVGEQMPESVSTEERGVQYVSPIDENMHFDLQAPLSSPLRNEDIEDIGEPISLESTAVAPLQPPAQDTFLALEMEETENLVIVLSDAAETSAPSISDLTSLEPRVPVNISAVERVSDVGAVGGASEVREPREFPSANDAPLTNSSFDVEDGEIEPDDPDELNVESLSQQIPTDFVDEDKEGGHSALDGIERDGEQLDEVPGDKKPLLNTDPLHSDVSEGLPMNQKLENMDGEKAQTNITTRQAGRGTAFLSLEKVRERALSRRTGPLPPSPGRRSTRGTKRSVVLHRGRINPPTVEPEDEQAKQPSESQSAPAADSTDSVREEE